MVIERNKDVFKLGFVRIKDYDNYVVNKQGIIISLNYNSKSNFYYIVSNYIDRLGYVKVKLFNNKKQRKNVFLHRIIATAFIPNPNNYPEINHKDYNRQNNSIDNLEWCNRAYNNKYSGKHRCYDSPNRIKIKRLNVITNEIVIFKSITEAAINSHVTFNTLYKSLNNKDYITNNMFKFEYAED